LQSHKLTSTHTVTHSLNQSIPVTQLALVHSIPLNRSLPCVEPRADRWNRGSRGRGRGVGQQRREEVETRVRRSGDGGVEKWRRRSGGGTGPAVRARAAGRLERPTPTLSRQSCLYPRASARDAANFFPQTLSVREAAPCFSPASSPPSAAYARLRALQPPRRPRPCNLCFRG
jgi:hypothetical protein